jgi:carbonic anhydrase
MIPAKEALDLLKQGNKRFVAGELSPHTVSAEARHKMAVETQSPTAIILGCSDSRVPAELVFDQGLGDLFVIRVAGNIVAPSQIGSVEFAAERFGVRLVVVLGHTHCGAVSACLSELQQPAENQSRNLRSIVGRIQPAVEPLIGMGMESDPDQLLKLATRTNVMVSVSHLRNGSELLERLIANEGLEVVGAEYSVETGEVDFFEKLS